MSYPEHYGRLRFDGIHKSPDYYKMVVCLLEHDKFDRKDIYKFLKLLLYIQIKIIVFKNIDNYILLILNKKY